MRISLAIARGSSRACHLRRAGGGFPWDVPKLFSAGADLWIVGSVGREHPPHLVHTPRHRRLGDAEDLGGFGVRELLAGHENDGLAIGGLQSADRAADPDLVVQVAAVRTARQ